MRNFVRAYQVLPPELKEEIGRHAYQFGVDESVAEYKGKVAGHLELSRVMVKRLRRYFMGRNPDLAIEDEEDEALQDDPISGQRNKRVFDISLRDGELGQQRSQARVQLQLWLFQISVGTRSTVEIAMPCIIFRPSCSFP